MTTDSQQPPTVLDPTPRRTAVVELYSRESRRLGALDASFELSLDMELVAEVLAALHVVDNQPVEPSGWGVESVARVAVAITALEHQDCGLNPDRRDEYLCQVPGPFDDFDPLEEARRLAYRAELFFDFLSVYLQQFPLRDMSHWHGHPDGTLDGATRRRALITALRKILEPAYRIVESGLVLPEEVSGSWTVIERPAFAALSGSRWIQTATSLTDASREIDEGRYGDAVTDIGTALQTALSAAGYAGKTLGEQMKKARSGYLVGTETKLGAAVDELCSYVASVRNMKSDAHPGPHASRADAELALRTVLSVATWLAERSP